jgi:hypothetical protein
MNNKHVLAVRFASSVTGNLALRYGNESPSALGSAVNKQRYIVAHLRYGVNAKHLPTVQRRMTKEQLLAPISGQITDVGKRRFDTKKGTQVGIINHVQNKTKSSPQ